MHPLALLTALVCLRLTAEAQVAPPAPLPALLLPPRSASPQQEMAGLSSQMAAPQCPVTVQYSVNLGQGQDFAGVPIFVATMAVLNNDPQVTINEWRMGWRFPFDSVIHSKQDVFDPAVVLLNPDSPTPVVETAGGETHSRSIPPGQPLQFGFLGTKGTAPLNATNPYNVGPVSSVAFNNLRCAPLPSPSPPSPPATDPAAAPTAQPGSAAPTPTDLQVDYTPIFFVGQPEVTTRSQFLVRVRNIRNTSTIALQDAALQYWFAGPEGGVPPSVQAAPWEIFEGRCEWASPPVGCAGVALGISTGFADVAGAQFALNVTFTNESGALAPTGEGAVEIVNLGKGLDVLDLLLTITTKAGVTLLNASQDYSFLDTPTPDEPLDASASVVPRRALPNPKLTADLRGRLVWGVSPNAAGAASDSSVAGAGGLQGGAPQPEGVSCEAVRGGAHQSCSLVAVYCCTAPDPAQPSVQPLPPKQWPPAPLALPGAEGTSSLAVPGTEDFTVLPPLPPAASGQQVDATSGGGGGGGSVSWIAGIAVGLAAGLVAATALVVAWRRRVRRQQLDKERRLLSGEDNPAGMANGEEGSSADANGMTWQGQLSNGSPHSSPSVAGSQRMLLSGRRFSSSIAPGGAFLPGGPDSYLHVHPLPPGHPLAKYPSDISGLSGSSHAGEGRDPEGVLDSFDSHGRADKLPLGGDITLQHSQQAEEPHQQGHSLPNNVLLLLERQVRTSPGLLGRGDREADGEVSSRASTPTGFSPATWQLRRSSSWDGIMHWAPGLDSWHQLQHFKRRRTELPGPLPPLSPLPPPLLPAAAPSPDVDLDVDWAELEGKLGRCLGTGGFGSVYEATWRGRQVAVKVLPPLSAGNGEEGGAPAPGRAAYEALVREIELASKFNCDKLVKVYGACTRDASRCCLIMELMQGGSLFHRIYDRNKRRLGYLELLQIAHDIAAGLAYLHPSVVHRDLKPQNVLLDSQGRVKLADFGISRVKDPTKSYLSQITSNDGTPGYQAPEVFNGTRLDEKVDVYALGCILNEAFTRRQPWRDTPHFFNIVLKVAINGERPWMDPDTPEPLRRLITKLWHQDPRVRPSCAEVMRITELLMSEELRKWETMQATPPAAAAVEAARVEG